MCSPVSFAPATPAYPYAVKVFERTCQTFERDVLNRAQVSHYGFPPLCPVSPIRKDRTGCNSQAYVFLSCRLYRSSTKWSLYDLPDLPQFYKYRFEKLQNLNSRKVMGVLPSTVPMRATSAPGDMFPAVGSCQESRYASLPKEAQGSTSSE